MDTAGRKILDEMQRTFYEKFSTVVYRISLRDDYEVMEPELDMCAAST